MEQKPLSRELSSSDDEIDLKELIIALWKGKPIIISTTILCVAVAIAYAMMAKQVWTTEAVITQPQVKDFADYQKMVNEFQPIFDIYQEKEVLVSSALDDFVKPSTLFNIYLQEFDSRANKKAYISTVPEFQADLKLLQSETKGDVYDKAESALYAQWYEKLSVAPIKGDNSSYTLKGELESSESSHALLNGYVEYVASRAKSVAIANLKAIVGGKRKGLEQQQSLFIDQAKGRLSYELERSKYALEIAKAAGLDKPQQNLGDQELFAINIGANALEAKVKVLDGLKDLSVLEPRLQQINAKLQLLANAKVDSNVSFETFQFVERPEKPISRTSPKRPLIVILGMLLGGMLGCAIVLVRYAFRTKE